MFQIKSSSRHKAHHNRTTHMVTLSHLLTLLAEVQGLQVHLWIKLMIVKNCKCLTCQFASIFVENMFLALNQQKDFQKTLPFHRTLSFYMPWFAILQWGWSQNCEAKHELACFLRHWWRSRLSVNFQKVSSYFSWELFLPALIWYKTHFHWSNNNVGL